MVWSVLERSVETEWLDQGQGTPTDVATSLSEIATINRWLGGYRALLTHLLPRVQAGGGPVTVLDLGTGDADVPRQITRRAADLGCTVQIVGLDLAARHLAIARQRCAPELPIDLVQADVLRLPIASQSVDFVISSLLLHHLETSQVRALLRDAVRIARRAVVMSDLVRGHGPRVAFEMVTPVFARHVLTRHDGALSICRAYTPDELFMLAIQPGLPTPALHTHWPWRMTLVIDNE